jgi:hypothetical protein
VGPRAQLNRNNAFQVAVVHRLRIEVQCITGHCNSVTYLKQILRYTCGLVDWLITGILIPSNCGSFFVHLLFW